MRIPAILSALLFALGGQVGPAAADDLDQFLTNANKVDRVDQMTRSIGEKASELVLTAMGFLGVPYRRGGDTGESGFDCSGFVKAMFEQTLGQNLPRRAEQQAAVTQKIERSALQPGDLVFFNTLRRAFSHVGIYVGEGRFIHSPKPGSEVRVEDMTMPYWKRRFDGARRVTLATQEASLGWQTSQRVESTLH